MWTFGIKPSTFQYGGPDLLVLSYNQEALNLDLLELLERFLPSEHERKLIQEYEGEGRPLDELGEEDRFMVHFSKIPRLAQRIRTLAFMGNFPSVIVSLQSVSSDWGKGG